MKITWLVLAALSPCAVTAAPLNPQSSGGLSAADGAAAGLRRVTLALSVELGVPGVSTTAVRGFIGKISRYYYDNNLPFIFVIRKLSWHPAGQPCDTDPHGGDVVLCMGPGQGGFMGPPYYRLGANTDDPYGFTPTGIRAEAHELGHFLGFQDLYWLQTQGTPAAPPVAQDDIMMSPYNEAAVFGPNAAYVLDMNARRLARAGRDAILYPRARAASKLKVEVAGAASQECALHIRDRNASTFNSTTRSTPSLRPVTDEQGVFTMDLIGGDEADNNFDLYYLVCGANAYWINSLATEDCYQKLGAGAVCPIRCETPGGWCSFAAD